MHIDFDRRMRFHSQIETGIWISQVRFRQISMHFWKRKTFYTTRLIFFDNQLVIGNWKIESKACWLCSAVLVNKHHGFYSICPFWLIKKDQKIKKIRSASARTTAPPRIFFLPAPERCLPLIKAGFVTGKNLNLFNCCLKLGVGEQLV